MKTMNYRDCAQITELDFAMSWIMEPFLDYLVVWNRLMDWWVLHL